jgi:hypothetical protein
MASAIKTPTEIEVVAGILKLTLDNKLQWTQFSRPAPKLDWEHVAPPANWDVGFEAIYEDSRLRLITGSELRPEFQQITSPTEKISSVDKYLKRFPDTTTTPALEVINQDGSLKWRFRNLEIIKDLYNVVRYKVAGVSALFQSIAKASG